MKQKNDSSWDHALDLAQEQDAREAVERSKTKNRFEKIQACSKRWHSKWEASKFTHRMARLLGIPERNLQSVVTVPPLNAGRINRLKVVSRDAFFAEVQAEGFDLRPIEWYPDGFTFSSPKVEFARSRFVQEGTAFIQNSSSFLPSLALQPHKGDEIFDACAAPGAKSSHISALAHGQLLHLWLNDGIKERLPKLHDVQRVLGLKCDEITSFPAQFADRETNRQFDRVLLDIQCSGEGMIDLNEPYSLCNWSMQRIQKYTYMQTKALRACFNLLRPGGTLVYSTCTYAPEENEAPITNLLKHAEDAAIEPLVFRDPYVRPGEKTWEGLKFHPDLSGALRVLPHEGMEGFFVCRIRKLGPNLSRDDLRPLDLMEEGRLRAREAEERAQGILISNHDRINIANELLRRRTTHDRE